MDTPKPLSQQLEYYKANFLAAWRESYKTSKRVRVGHKRLAEEGRLISGLQNAFGHDPIHRDEVQVGGTARADEAALIQELTKRVQKGQALYAIATDWAERGVRGRENQVMSQERLRRLATSPRMAGLQRASGKLYEANIERIISRQDWERNCEIFGIDIDSGEIIEGSRRSYTKPEMYPLSGTVCHCLACDGDIVGTRLKRRGGQLNYKCNKKHLNYVGRCKCGKPGGRCVCKRDHMHSFDGLRHPNRRKEPIERFLVEIALAALDAKTVASAADSVLNSRSALSAQSEQLDQDLEALNTERKGLARQAAKGLLTEEEEDEMGQEVMTNIAETKAKLIEVRTRIEDADAVTDPNEVRAQVNHPINGPHYIRDLISKTYQWVGIGASSRDNPCGNIEVKFADGYSADNELVEELREELNMEYRREYRLNSDFGQTDQSTEELVIKLWVEDEQVTTGDIARTLNQRQVPTVRGGNRWTATSVRNVVIRGCDRRGIEYEPRSATTINYPAQTRSMIFELCKAKKPFAEIATELNQMGVATLTGKPWVAKTLRAVYGAECARRGKSPRGRSNQLSDDLRLQIRLMHKVEHKTHRQIADWLNGSGVKRDNGKDWDRQSVVNIVAREEQRLAQD